jgi:hypothetical protein
MATVKKASSKKVTSKKAAVKKAPAASVTVKCGNWQAWHDFMPIKPPTLYVTGECTVPPGTKVTLRMAVPQGINPKILLLRKIVTPPPRPRKGPPVKVEVRYVKKTSFEYTHVTILPDGKTVKVKRVS